MSSDPLADLVGHGESFPVYVRHELEPWRTELVERLGGRIVVSPEAPACAVSCGRKECRVPVERHTPTPGRSFFARDATVMHSRYNGGSGMLEEGEKNLTPEIESLDECTRPDGCRWEAVCTLDSLCWAAERHARAHHKPDPEPWPRQDDLNEKESKTVVKRIQWTRELCLDAVRQFVEKHGRSPTIGEGKPALGLPSQTTVSRLFGGWPAMVRAAGFEPSPTGRAASRTGPAQPSPEETDHAASPSGGAEEPEPEEEAVSALPVLPTAPPPTARPAVADPDKVDVFELFRELATEERIDFYEESARQAKVKAEALRQIRDALGALAE